MRYDVTLANGSTMELIEVGTTKSLPSFSMVGGYPLFYLDGQDNVLCAGCASDIIEDYEAGDDIRALPVTAHVNWEAEMYCDCGKRIPEAYPEEEDG